MPSKNSPVEDTMIPQPTRAQITEDNPTVWQQLAGLPDFYDYIEKKIEFYQKYLPNGKSISDLKKEETRQAWQNAVVIIGELESMRNMVQLLTNKDD